MEQFVKQFDQMQQQMFNYFGETTRSTLLLAATYTLHNKPFSGMALEKKIEEVRKQIKNESSLLFPMRDLYAERDFASKLMIYEQTMEQHIENYKILIAAGFPDKSYTLQASSYVEGEAQAKRAYELHQEMKKYHPFLTGADDIPISVFIAQNKELHISNTAKLMNTYYNELKQHFSQGETLQLLSQLLFIWSPQYNEHLVPYVVQLKEEFKKRNIRITKNTYPLLGILALNTANTELVNEIFALYEKLAKLKCLKFNKEIALQIAVQKIVTSNIEAMKIAGAAHYAGIHDLVYLSVHLTNLTLNVGKVVLDLLIFD